MAIAPITWKNIDAPDFTGAAQIQELAARRLDKGFESARGIVDTLGKQQAEVQTRNAADFNARVAQQFQSPDALRQAQASGQIDALRQRYLANGGLDPATTGSGAITSLIDQGQQQQQGMEAHAMAQRINESNLTTASQTRQQSAGRYKTQQDTAAKTEFEAEEAEKLSMLVGNSNAAGIQQGLDSDTLGRPDVWQTALKDMQTGAVRNAMDINLANGNIEGAQAAIPALPVDQRAAATTRLDPIQKEAQIKTENDALVSVYTEGKQLDQVDAEEQLIRQQDLFRAGVDVQKAATDDDYFNSLDSGQLDMYQAFAQDTAAGYSQKNRQTDTSIAKEITQGFIDKGMNPDEAKVRADEVVGRIQSSTSISGTEKGELELQDAELRRAFKGNSVVEGSYDPVNEAGVQELVGENYEKLQGLTGKAKASADEVLGWVRQGEMPADEGEGINGKWPLTRELVKLAFNSTEGGQSIFWDTITPGTTNVKERFRDFIKAGIYDPEELKGFEDYRQQRADNERNAQISADASVGVVQDFRGAQAVNEASVAAEKRLAQSILPPGQAGGQAPALQPTTAIQNNVQAPGEQIRQAALQTQQQLQDVGANAGSTRADFNNTQRAAIANIKLVRSELSEAKRIAPENVPALEAQLEQSKRLSSHYAEEGMLRDELDNITESIERMSSDDSFGEAAIIQYKRAYVEAMKRLQAHQARLQGN